MKKKYTREEVVNIIVSVLMFSNANNNQGCTQIKGDNYGQQAETVIEANDAIIGTMKSMLSVVSMFRTGVNVKNETELIQKVKELAKNGRKLEAVKLVCQTKGIHLMEGKEYVDNYL